MSESDLIAAILHASAEWPSVRLWRQNTGAARGPGGVYIRFGVPGQADISGILAPHGQRIEIEAKTKTGRQRPEQKKWQAMIERFGGLYILARSVDDVRAGLGL